MSVTVDPVAERRRERQAEINRERVAKHEAMMAEFPQDPATAHRMWLGTDSGSTVKVDCPGKEHCSLWFGTNPGVDGSCGLIEMVDDIGTEFLEYQTGLGIFPPSQPFPIGFTWTNQGEDEWPEVDWWAISDTPNVTATAPVPGHEDVAAREAEWNLVYNALRDNWEHEATPEQVVDWIFAALRTRGMWALKLTEQVHDEAVKMTAAVFADIGPTVDFAALASNVLRVLRGEK